MIPNFITQSLWWKIKPKNSIVFVGYDFHPKKDITTYELAVIFSISIMPKNDQIEYVSKLAPSFTRHLIRINLNTETGERIKTAYNEEIRK